MKRTPILLPVEKLGRALEALPDGIAFFVAGWTIGYVNPAGAALLQCPADHLVGRNIRAALLELARLAVCGCDRAAGQLGGHPADRRGRARGAAPAA